MNKQQFLALLRQELSGLPREDVEERLAFYDEMIDDRIEEGLSEEAAVAEIGSVDEIVEQILAETPFTKLVKERIKPSHRLRAWEVVLLVLGFPLWFPLLLAAFAVVLAVYIVIWAVVISLWAVEISVAVTAFACLVGGIVVLFKGGVMPGLLLISAGMVLAGLSVLLFFGCLALTKGAVFLTKKIALWIKSLFIRKNKEEKTI